MIVNEWQRIFPWLITIIDPVVDAWSAVDIVLARDVLDDDDNSGDVVVMFTPVFELINGTKAETRV